MGLGRGGTVLTLPLRWHGAARLEMERRGGSVAAWCSGFRSTEKGEALLQQAVQGRSGFDLKM